MKTRISLGRKIWLAALSFILALCATMLVLPSVFKANAQPITIADLTAEQFKMVKGAEVRGTSYAETENGIKFTASMPIDTYNALKDNYETLTFGTFILPKYYVDNYGAPSQATCFDEATSVYVWGVDQVPANKHLILHNVSATPTQGVANEVESAIVEGAVIDMKDNNIGINYVGFIYVKGVDSQDNVTYKFATQNDNARSMLLLACKALEALPEDATTERANVQSYINTFNTTFPSATFSYSKEIYLDGVLSEDYSGTVSGQKLLANVSLGNDINGYALDTEAAGSVLSGKVLPDNSLTLVAYYDKIEIATADMKALAKDTTSTYSATFATANVKTGDVYELNLSEIQGDFVSLTVDGNAVTDATLSGNKLSIPVASLATVTAGDKQFELKTSAKSYTIFVTVADQVISTATELGAFLNQDCGGEDTINSYAVLGADITDTVTRTSSNKKRFVGTFDGMGHTIKDVVVQGTQNAMFHTTAYVKGTTATIKNVIFENVTATSDQSSALIYIVGNSGTTTIENVYFGDITLRANRTSSFQGGVISRVQGKLEMTDCIVNISADINKPAIYGALCGQVTGSVPTITNSYFNTNGIIASQVSSGTNVVDYYNTLNALNVAVTDKGAVEVKTADTALNIAIDKDVKNVYVDNKAVDFTVTATGISIAKSEIADCMGKTVDVYVLADGACNKYALSFETTTLPELVRLNTATDDLVISDINGTIKSVTDNDASVAYVAEGTGIKITAATLNALALGEHKLVIITSGGIYAKTIVNATTILNSATEMISFRENNVLVENQYVVLNCDITTTMTTNSSNFWMGGNSSTQGAEWGWKNSTFDGRGHTINSITIRNAFINSLDGSTVKNLVFASVTLTNVQNGLVARYVWGNSSIENVAVKVAGGFTSASASSGIFAFSARTGSTFAIKDCLVLCDEMGTNKNNAVLGLLTYSAETASVKITVENTYAVSDYYTNLAATTNGQSAIGTLTGVLYTSTENLLAAVDVNTMSSSQQALLK